MDIIINANRSEPPPNLRTQNPTLPPLAQLMKSLGFPEIAPPIADFLRQVHQLEGQWLLCEPVYWEAGNNDAVIVADARVLQIPETQSLPLFEKVQKFLGEAGFLLHYHNAYTWLIRVDGRPKLNSLPTHAMLHRSMIASLRDIDTSMYWPQLMTELQMFLKSIEESSHPINGFWFYGYEAFQFKKNQTLWTDNEQFIAAFPQHVKALDFGKLFDKGDVVWMENSPTCRGLTTASIDPAVKPRHVGGIAWDVSCGARWFWNNMTYVTPEKSWWRNWLNNWMNRSS